MQKSSLHRYASSHRYLTHPPSPSSPAEYRGTPDPLHADEFNRRVREVAADLLNHLHSSESETFRGGGKYASEGTKGERGFGSGADGGSLW